MPDPRRALPPAPRSWLRRLALAGVVLAAAGILLVAYVVSSPQPSAVDGPGPSASPSRVSPRPTAPSATASGTPASSDPRLLLDENFDAPTLDTSIWNTCHWWDADGCTISSNDELQWYRPEQVSVRDGALQLTADRDPYEASDGESYEFRSGMVTTGPPEHGAEPKLAFTYGSVEARLRIPAGQGLWAAMWLLPADEDSRPEIDVLEALGDDPDEMIMHFHPADRDADSPSSRHRLADSRSTGGWHTIRLDWTPNRLQYFADGKEVWRLNGSQVPSEPMYLVFNLAVGGAYPGSPNDSTEFPSTFAIDHVRVAAAA